LTGSIAFLIAPPILAAILLRVRPRLRVRPWVVAGYLLLLTLLIGSAMLFVAYVASAQLAATEVAIVVWLTASLRLTWELWAYTLGRVGQRWVRWERRARTCGRRGRPLIRAIPVLRGVVSLAVFVPAALAFVLTHRFKLGDGTNPRTALHLSYQTVRIPTRDGLSLEAWFVPAPGAERTIVICHGAGANKGNFVWFLGPLAHHGWNLLLFDFRAHGGSDGRVCTYGIFESRDVQACLDWLSRERPDCAKRIVGLGSSLGSMALTLAAADDPRISAIVLDSPFLGPRDLARHHFSRLPVVGPFVAEAGLRWMSAITGADFLGTSAAEAVARFDRPVLVIHGDDDWLMPVEHAQQLHAVAAGRREIWLGPGPHSNIVTTEPEEYARRVFDFLGP
jgi:uncharacterized protein